MNPSLRNKYGKDLALQSVEVKVSDTSGKYYLPDDAILREKQVVGWFTDRNDDDDVFSPTNRAIISPAGIRNARLYLYAANDRIIDGMPLESFAVNPADKAVVEWELCGITPSKSYVEVANPSGKVAAGESIMLYFLYLDK